MGRAYLQQTKTEEIVRLEVLGWMLAYRNSVEIGCDSGLGRKKVVKIEKLRKKSEKMGEPRRKLVEPRVGLDFGLEPGTGTFAGHDTDRGHSNN